MDSSEALILLGAGFLFTLVLVGLLVERWGAPARPVGRSQCP